MGLTRTKAWQALAQHRDQIAGRHMRELFAADPQRFDRLSARLDDFLVDFSKQHIVPETIPLLTQLAHRRNLATGIARMMSVLTSPAECTPTEMPGSADYAAGIRSASRPQGDWSSVLTSTFTEIRNPTCVVLSGSRCVANNGRNTHVNAFDNA